MKPKIKAIIFDWVDTLYERDKDLFPFTLNVVKYLSQKYKLGLISLASEENLKKRKHEIETSPIYSYMDYVIIDQTKTPKQYNDCMKEMGVTPDQTMVVDDRTIRGILVGNKLGCKTCWVTKGKYANQVPDEQTGEPDYRIESIEELLDML